MSISLDSITFPSISGLDSDKNNSPPVNGPDNIVGFQTNNYIIPLGVVIIIVVIIAYYILFSSLGSDVTSSSYNQDSSTIELFLWGLFILLILLNGMSYIFNLDVIASIKNIFSPVTTVDLHIREKNTDTTSASGTGAGAGAGADLIKKQEVFHVSDNKYNYEDAKAICAAYDGRLANYNEINQAYNDGADWCSYGWSDNQMALFPTQEEKWNKLQTIDGHHHDCGRPGINGGYIDNPNVRFGVNCYGFKPEITSEQAERMQNQQIYPKNKKEIMFDKKVDYWRKKLSDIMVAPFNNQSWSIM
jgi:hypothetical protein